MAFVVFGVPTPPHTWALDFWIEPMTIAGALESLLSEDGKTRGYFLNG